VSFTGTFCEIHAAIRSMCAELRVRVALVVAFSTCALRRTGGQMRNGIGLSLLSLAWTCAKSDL
jgi:hypothetical protein